MINPSTELNWLEHVEMTPTELKWLEFEELIEAMLDTNMVEGLKCEINTQKAWLETLIQGCSIRERIQLRFTEKKGRVHSPQCRLDLIQNAKLDITELEDSLSAAEARVKTHE